MHAVELEATHAGQPGQEEERRYVAPPRRRAAHHHRARRAQPRRLELADTAAAAPLPQRCG